MQESNSLTRPLNNSDLSSSFRQKKLRMILFAGMSGVFAVEVTGGLMSSAYAQSGAQEEAVGLRSSKRFLNWHRFLAESARHGHTWKLLPARISEWEGRMTSNHNRADKDIDSSIRLEGEEDRELYLDNLTGRMSVAGGKVRVKGTGANRLKQFALEGNATLDLSDITGPSMRLNNFSSAEGTTIILGNNKTLKLVFTGD